MVVATAILVALLCASYGQLCATVRKRVHELERKSKNVNVFSFVVLLDDGDTVNYQLCRTMCVCKMSDKIGCSFEWAVIKRETIAWAFRVNFKHSQMQGTSALWATSDDSTHTQASRQTLAHWDGSVELAPNGDLTARLLGTLSLNSSKLVVSCLHVSRPA